MARSWGIFLLAAFMLFSAGAIAANAEILFVTNKDVPVDSLTSNQIQDIFLGKMVKWPDNSRVHFVVLEGGVHDSFLKQYIKRTSSQYNVYWKKMLFTGKGNKPKSFDSEKALVDYVKQTKGAIGYVGQKTAAADAKIISVN